MSLLEFSRTFGESFFSAADPSVLENQISTTPLDNKARFAFLLALYLNKFVKSNRRYTFSIAAK